MSATRRIQRRESAQPTGEWPSQWPPLLQRIHAARGSQDAGAAMPRLADLLPPDGMHGLQAAVTLLQDAIMRDARILVVGDFDCDGATA